MPESGLSRLFRPTLAAALCCTLAVFAHSPQGAHAQTAACPPAALLSIARAGAACASLDAGAACLGGTGVLAPREPVGLFTQPGDRAPLAALDSLAVTADPAQPDAVSLAFLNIRTRRDGAGDVAAVLVGGASVQRSDTAPTTTEVLAIGSVPVRARPSAEADAIAQVAVNGGLLASGRTEDGGWVRVEIPGTGQVGWAAAALVSGGGQGLAVVDPAALVQLPFESFVVRLETAAFCGGALPAGVLVQSATIEPDEAARMVVNGAQFALAGTVWAVGRGESASAFIVLEGRVTIDDVLVPPGAAFVRSTIGDQIGVNQGPTRLTEAEIAALALLPVNNLPRRIRIAAPLTTDDAFAAAVQALVPPTAAPPPTPQPPDPERCVRSAARNTRLFAGPGTTFEVIGDAAAGSVLVPVLASEDADDRLWYLLDSSAWIAAADVRERGNCAAEPVPFEAVIAAPSANTLVMERCESLNGPVRSGQWVTLRFMPPAWNSYQEAEQATRTDPGRFTVGSARLRAYASAPILLGTVQDPLESRYLREFTAQWQAEPGTFLITSDWYFYELRCTITVPIE
jgi:hypothetical protein